MKKTLPRACFISIKKKKFITQRWHKLAAFFPKLQWRNSKVLAHEFSLEHSFNKLETLLSFSPWIFIGAFFQQTWNIVVLQRWDKLATFCQNCIEEKIVAVQIWHKLAAFLPKLQWRNSKLLAHEFSLEHSFNKLETLLSYKEITALLSGKGPFFRPKTHGSNNNNILL